MEPERKIEKLLRAYAEKRRAEAGDPLKLHPANRRILQGEAASTLRGRTATEDGRRVPEADEGDQGNWLLLLFAVVRRRLVFIACVAGLIAIGVALLQPAGTSKKKVQSLEAFSNLKQIGWAVHQYADNNKKVLPASLDEITNALGTSRDIIDPVTGKPFVYAGAGRRLDGLQSNMVLAYSLGDEKSHAVLFADGRVETVTGARLTELTNQKPVEFALADKSGREQSAETPPAAPPVASTAAALPPPTPERAKMTQAKDQFKTGDLGMNAPSAAEPAKRQPELAQSELKKTEPVAAPVPIGSEAESLGGAKQIASVNGLTSAKLPATENSDALARSRSFYQLAMQTNSGQLFLAASQNFVQAGVSSVQNLFKNSTASAQATPVLQSFQMQQNGDLISVVDRDGSIYHGAVQAKAPMFRDQPAPAASPPGAVVLRQAGAAPPAGNQQQAAQNYFFRVAGMNRTLQQNVVFTGNVEAVTNATTNFSSGNTFGGVGGGGGGGGGGGVPAQNNQQASANQSSQQNFLSNSRIVGTAVIASTNQIEINAVPVTQ